MKEKIKAAIVAYLQQQPIYFGGWRDREQSEATVDGIINFDELAEAVAKVVEPQP